MDEVKPKVHPERLESGALKREAKLLSAMVHDYCRRHHGGESLCEDCKTFLTYALTRLACCPFEQKKPTCLKCKIHCYRAQEKETARVIMREEGSRMLLKHPILTAEHLIKNTQEAPDKPRNPHARKANP